MKNKTLNYCSLIFCLTMFFISCNDIVTYNDNYDDESTSYGPPSINRIASIDDSEDNLSVVSFGQMLKIYGDNLSKVTSIKFNDQEVDIKEIYALSKQIVVPVPNTVPNEITNSVTVTTEKGTVTYPIKIAFPDLIITGFSLEFGYSGDVVDVLGENLRLYDLTPENGTALINGNPVTIVECTDTKMSFLVPEGINNNSVLTLSSTRITSVLGTEPIELPFRDTGIQFIDYGASYLTHNATKGLATDGTKAGDPAPLIAGVNFSRVSGTVANNSTHQFVASYAFNAPLTDSRYDDLRANPLDYDIKYEIYVKEEIPITNFAARVRMLFNGTRPTNEFEWIPSASGVPYTTYDKWATRTSDGKYYLVNSSGVNTIKETANVFIFQYINGGLGVPTDVSVTNIRFAKKINIRRQQQ